MLSLLLFSFSRVGVGIIIHCLSFSWQEKQEAGDGGCIYSGKRQTKIFFSLFSVSAAITRGKHVSKDVRAIKPDGI
jgi:hypothetical protein